MGGEYDDRALGHVLDLFDEDGASSLQAPHHVQVVDDLTSNVDRRAELLERSLHRLNGSLDPRAKRPRRREDDLVFAAHVGPSLQRSARGRQ